MKNKNKINLGVDVHSNIIEASDAVRKFSRDFKDSVNVFCFGNPEYLLHFGIDEGNIVDAPRNINSSLEKMLCSCNKNSGDSEIIPIDCAYTTADIGSVVESSKKHLGLITDNIENPFVLREVPKRSGRGSVDSFFVMYDSMGGSEPYSILEGARMASVYLKKARSVEDPVVGTWAVNKNLEENSFPIEEIDRVIGSYAEKNPLNYKGQVEDVFADEVSLVLTDRFSGKELCEVWGYAMGSVGRDLFGGSRFGIKSMIDRLYQRFVGKYSPEPYKISPLVGVRGNVVVGRGEQSSDSIYYGLKRTLEDYNSGVLEELRNY